MATSKIQPNMLSFARVYTSKTACQLILSILKQDVFYSTMTSYKSKDQEYFISQFMTSLNSTAVDLM